MEGWLRPPSRRPRGVSRCAYGGRGGAWRLEAGASARAAQGQQRDVVPALLREGLEDLVPRAARHRRAISARPVAGRTRLRYASAELRGRSVVVAQEPSKLLGRVRFPSPALKSKTHGEWRSLVAHPAGGRAVAGSNPVSPTQKRPADAGLFASMSAGRTFGLGSNLVPVAAVSADVAPAGRSGPTRSGGPGVARAVVVELDPRALDGAAYGAAAGSDAVEWISTTRRLPARSSAS